MDLAGHATYRIPVTCSRCATTYDCDYGYIGRRLRCKCGCEVPILATEEISTEAGAVSPTPKKTSRRNVRLWARLRPIPAAALAIVLIAASSLIIHFEGRAIAKTINAPNGNLHKDDLASRPAQDSPASEPQEHLAKYEVADVEPSPKKFHHRPDSPCTRTDARTRSVANLVCP
jgi:hypothetical protein